MRPKAWFPLVLRILRLRDFYDFPTSGILTTSVNTASQATQTVSDFYDVIGRIGKISTLKVHPQWSVIFTMNVNMKFVVRNGRPRSGISTVSVNMKSTCLGHRGAWFLSLLATKALFSVNYRLSIINVYFWVLQSNTKYKKGESELCLKLYSLKGAIDLEIVDLTLMIRPWKS